MLICSDLRIEDAEFKEILNFMLALELFDKNLYEAYGVITNESVQKHYLFSSSRRKHIEMIYEYYLISDTAFVEEINDKIKKVLHFSSIHADNIYFNVGTNTQSKVKKSKANESKENQIKENERTGTSAEKKRGAGERENLRLTNDEDFSNMFPGLK